MDLLPAVRVAVRRVEVSSSLVLPACIALRSAHLSIFRASCEVIRGGQARPRGRAQAPG